ncbi:MAG: T9SS type A sorting domain-containing protein, partial [Bacteroidota bacterium]
TASDDQQNDSGLASVALDAGATNLTLTVDPFDAGAATTTFTVTLTDPSQPGSGRVEAIDMVGNTSGLDVELDTAPLPDYDIVATATYAFEGAADGTITVTVRNIGANAMPAVRVIVKSSQDVTLAQSTQVIGEIAAGASRDAVFDFSNAGPNAEVFFQAQDTQIRRGESDLDNNEVTIAPVNEGGDVAPPVIGGSVTLNGSVPRFDGTASETGANDTGVASIALANGATNVALTVDPFIAGATNVGFAVTLVDDSQSGSGTVEATDVEGNVAVYEVALVLAGNDTSAPTITGTFRRRAYEGTATDDQPNDTGIASVTLSNDAVNMVLDVDPFTPGDPVVTFKLSAADPAQPTSGTVVATDVAGNEGSTFLTRGRAASSLASDEDAEAGQRHAEDLAAAGAVADAVEGGKPSTETDAVAADATEPASHESDDREAASEAPSGVKPQTDAATPEDASSSGKPSLELATDAVANDAALTAPADASEAVSSSLAAEAPLSSLSTSAEAAPSDGTLSVRAYPNPVTAAATLRFHVPSESAARIAVYDLSGRRVALVHDGTLSAGWHDLIVDARRWPSGVYLWRVETATQAETGRFTVIR